MHIMLFTFKYMSVTYKSVCIILTGIYITVVSIITSEFVMDYFQQHTPACSPCFVYHLSLGLLLVSLKCGLFCTI